MPSELSVRESELLRRLAAGADTRDIARQMYAGRGTAAGFWPELPVADAASVLLANRIIGVAILGSWTAAVGR